MIRKLLMFTLCSSLFGSIIELEKMDVKLMSSGWQSTLAGKSVDGNTFSIAGKKFTSGVGTHSPSVGTVKLDGKADKFTALIGVDDEITGPGSLEFIVRGDHKTLYRSPVMRKGDQPIAISVPLKGYKELILQVTDGGDTNGHDHANWVDAKIHYSGSIPKFIVSKDLGDMVSQTQAIYQPEFSTAGFYQLDDSPRQAANFNLGWRFFKGDKADAFQPNFDDQSWPVVNAPHGLELVPEAASGSVNYQGPAWYRKRFTLDNSYNGKRVYIHFEAIMGKSKIWLNGKLLKEQFGGYLPIHLDITDHVKAGVENIIAVRTDNSDDPIYPPGKPQTTLDFTYFGGIYRDVHLISTSDIHVTNANHRDYVADGGTFVHFSEFSKEKVTVNVKTNITNQRPTDSEVNLALALLAPDGTVVGKSTAKTLIKSKKDQTIEQSFIVNAPQLWHVNDPKLHRLSILVQDQNGKTVDSFYQRIGIRKIEFRGKEGFFLNGEKFDDKLIGGNRHQDFAVIGNAVPNSLQWRDAKKLRDAAMRVIRCAHYPMDPAFMDACDELGLFVIIATPGWQFWNKEPIFEQRVISDIRNMVRRDRNHASTFMWEPILNETWYPATFAKKVHETVHQEFPYPSCYTACDAHARGQEYFDVIYSHPFSNGFWSKNVEDNAETRQQMSIDYDKINRPVFTREWGDCVDNWSDHNSPSRVAKHWGEAAQLVQAKHYSNPDYIYTCWDTLYDTPAQHVGGTIWHPFDHQRGYHPDTFWGGILDAYRQPKYSYYMFKAQQPTDLNIPNVDSKPFVYIAHEMTPVSDEDIVVFSNCDEVRLKRYGKEIATQKTTSRSMPHAPVVFKDQFKFMDIKALSRQGKGNMAKFEVEGIIDGKVVTTATKAPSARRSKIILKADFSGIPLTADGSDIVAVVAYISDRHGRVKRLNNESVRFSVEGEGELIGNRSIGTNPQKAAFGEAVALIRASDTAGPIYVTASPLRSGKNQPRPVTLEIQSVPTSQKLVYTEKATGSESDKESGQTAVTDKILQQQLNEALEELNRLKLKEVERQQQEFEGNSK